ncbi:hypothetical protein NYO91_07235 [Arhodomonas aquaeolei]|uniref:hypothetical protein n=1 Tax=Arhodomonas aquaeolei TaxID=2369 RepID=UPI002168BEE0|nr:hypothetical protein [Arhodomonas aquaeolei]MCS4503869.1 hypothetical protein [Arhodomonas aquaeolei]
MTAEGQLRGHPIYWDEAGQAWRFCDTGEPTHETWRQRPCALCGRHATAAGHDPCLGELPGVTNACCGHGHAGDAYIQFANGVTVRGFPQVEHPEPS